MLTIIQDGATFTGTMANQRGSTAIEQGKIEGNEISFVIVQETPRGTRESTYTGKFEDGKLTGTMTAGGGRFTINWSAERAET